MILGAAASTAAGLVAAAWYAGIMSSGGAPVTPPLFVAVNVVATIALAWCALALDRTGHSRVGRWVLAVSVSAAAYAVVVTAAFTATEAGTAWSSWFVAAEGAWYLVPLTVAGSAAIVAVEELTADRGRRRGFRILLVALATANVVTGLGTVDADSRYPGVRAPLDGTWWDSPVVAVLFGVTATAWMLSTALPAIVGWRAARQTEALARARLVVVTVAALAPPFTIASCLILIAAQSLNAIDAAVGTVVTAVAFCLSTTLVGWGIRAGTTARDDGVTGAAVMSVRRVLGGLWALTAAQLAVVLAAVVGVRGRDVESYAVGTVAVVLVVTFIAAFVPLARRLSTFTTPEVPPPGRATTSALAGTLSPREREVLALLAEGRTNAGIAGTLFVSERTVDSHVSSIFDKLGLGRGAEGNRRVQAAAAWLQASRHP